MNSWPEADGSRSGRVVAQAPRVVCGWLWAVALEPALDSGCLEGCRELKTALAIEVQASDVPLTALDIINFYAEWGASWLLAVNPARVPACNATVEGSRLAREQSSRPSSVH